MFEAVTCDLIATCMYGDEYFEHTFLSADCMSLFCILCRLCWYSHVYKHSLLFIHYNNMIIVIRQPYYTIMMNNITAVRLLYILTALIISVVITDGYYSHFISSYIL